MSDDITSAPFDRSLVPDALLDAALVERLADEFGTPLFVYDEDELRARCREYVEHFGTGNVAYAGKAFLCTAMAQLVADEGLTLDVATGGELHVALHAGFPPGRLVMHGNNKSDDELARALDAGIGTIVVDSFDEIDRLERLAAGATPPIDVLVRVTPGVEAHTHVFIETGTEDSKFGFTVSDGVALRAATRVARSDRLHLRGLHCHIGSQITVLPAYGRALDVLADLARAVQRDAGVVISELSLGGGLGARYLHDDPGPSVAMFAGEVRAALSASGLDPCPRLTVEPGRSIAARAAITVYRVGTVKLIPNVGTYVAVDGGMSDNPRPVLYGAGYEAYLPARVDEARPLAAAIVGKHCEQGDILVRDARLPSGVSVGDLLAVPVTGAYGYAMASNYNKVPRPAVVFVRDGTARPVVRRETLDDLVSLDV